MRACCVLLSRAPVGAFGVSILFTAPRGGRRVLRPGRPRRAVEPCHGGSALFVVHVVAVGEAMQDGITVGHVILSSHARTRVLTGTMMIPASRRVRTHAASICDG